MEKDHVAPAGVLALMPCSRPKISSKLLWQDEERVAGGIHVEQKPCFRRV
jgi:hypothetical protein